MAPASILASARFNQRLSARRIAAGISSVLAIQELGGIELPGCGVKSACAQAAASYWAVLPGTSWPTVFAGLAYFLGLFVIWAGSAFGVPPVVRWIVRVAAAGSLWLLIVLFASGQPCWYCIGAHLLHLAFWVLLERAPRSERLPRVQALLAVAIVLVTSLTLGLQQFGRNQSLLRRGAADLSESTRRIMQAMLDRNRATPGFRGRYLHGPESAAVRIVLFTDYQCEECQRIEPQIQSVLGRQASVSLSIKHFPFCSQCNPAVTGAAHENACWAARAAETAGLLWGSAGFFAMHGWLMSNAGKFETEHELEAGIEELGFDPEGFVEQMTAERTRQFVEADVREALAHGLFQTPTIFINGEELRGWQVENGISRAVERLLSEAPEARTHQADRPLSALEKAVQDWSDPENTPCEIAEDRPDWALGSADAQITITLFGDLQEPVTGEANGIVRAWLVGRSDARYSFRNYPLDSACNPHTRGSRTPQSCWAALCVEAAAGLCGADAAWRVQSWMLAHQEQLSDDRLRASAATLDLDVDRLIEARGRATAQAALGRDLEAAQQVGLIEIPTLFINGKRVFRWRWEGLDQGPEILKGLLDAAALRD